VSEQKSGKFILEKWVFWKYLANSYDIMVQERRQMRFTMI